MNGVATITANDGGQSARLAPLRQWLEEIVATLPETRQQMYDLFVARALDSRSVALELGTSVAEVRRLRSENQQAILRAFEVTALAAAETATETAAETGEGRPGVEGSGCGQLRQLLADAQRRDGDLRAGGPGRAVVLPAALRLVLSRHLGTCLTCQVRRDECRARWAAELQSILADAELRERVPQDVQSMPMPEPRQVDAPRRAASAGRAASTGIASRIVVPRPAAAAAGGGLLVALLLAFVWPGVLHSPRGSTAPSSRDSGGIATIGTGAPAVTGTFDGVPGRDGGRPVRPGTAGLLSSLPTAAARSSAAPSSVLAQPSVYYTLPPSSASASSPAEPSFGPPATGWPATQAPSSPPRSSSPTPSAAPTTRPPATPPSRVPPTTPAPTPTVSASTPTATPSAAPSVSAPTAPPPDPSPSSASPTASPTVSPTVSPSTVAPPVSAAS